MTARRHGSAARFHSKCPPARHSSIGPHRALTTATFKELQPMLWTIAVILFIMWALGMLTSFTAAGLIHVLLVLAIIAVLIRVIQGRRVI
jgi:hypothetical protein